MHFENSFAVEEREYLLSGLPYSRVKFIQFRLIEEVWRIAVRGARNKEGYG
jgi:hypothetical protein